MQRRSPLSFFWLNSTGAPCRDREGRMNPVGVNSPTIKPNIEAYAPRNSESGGYVVVCWRHTVNLKQTKLKQTLGVSLSVKTRKRKDLDLKNYHSSPC
jgi:hypothetical protein